MAEECESVPELDASVDEQRNETVSPPEDRPVGGEECVSESELAAAGVVEEGAGETVAGEGEESILGTKSEEETERVDVRKGEAFGAEEAPVIGESQVSTSEKDASVEPTPADQEESAAVDGGGELGTVAIDSEPRVVVDARGDEMNAESEFAPAVDGELATAVTDSEPQMGDRGDETLVDHRLVMNAESEFAPVVESNVEAVVTADVGDAPQLSELEMDARGDELQGGMEAGECKPERQVDGEVNFELGVIDKSVDSWMVEDNAAIVADDNKTDEENVGVAVSDSEAGTVGKPAAIEDEKVDHVIMEEMPITEVKTDAEMITEVNALAVNVSEDEKVERVIAEEMPIAEVKTDTAMITEGDASAVNVSVRVHESIGGDMKCKDVDAEGNLVPETKMVEDESLSSEVLRDSKETEPVNLAENMDTVLKEDLPAGDRKIETEVGVELESPRKGGLEEIQLAENEVETKFETEAVANKIPDEDDRLDSEETSSDVDESGQDIRDSAAALQDEEDEAMIAEEETGTQDTEMETETDMADSGKTSGGKRKRGKFSKSPSLTKAAAKASSRKTVGEDVCFICFDGGELVLCDRRGCPKAYHPSCVNRDEAFFKSKGRWNCGWHLCSICEKNARYMCYTCTYSLCKSCTKDAAIFCVRKNKGFCENCMRTVMLIENNEQGAKDSQIDFDDRSSWEYLFKDYYIELKAKLDLSAAEIAEAKNPWKGADTLSGPSRQESPEALGDANDGGSGSDDSIENVEVVRPKRRKTRKQLKSRSKEEQSVSTDVAAGDKVNRLSDNSEWASKELLEFVSHMKNDDTSMLSQFDVQALLLEYIKGNKLRDPRRKSQIICDTRLENLFGKPRVGHFEMLKLLESHFLIRDEQNDDFQGSVVDTENNQLDDGDADPLYKGVKDRKRKSRKKGYRGPQSNLDDYAAIDMHNIGLIYLRRKLMEDLLEDEETFHDKVVGTFVRIRISGSTQKQDMYRLVQVAGTSKATEPYKIGKKTTETMVEILNLDKTEIISIDTISNQEFTEEECKRLRQSIKCGLISRLTVGEILDKTMEIQAARVNDWLESEVQRLSHLRDRASDLGRRKELRECVEKLQLLKTPEERRRRLEEIPEIHADPKMDPSYESEDNDSEAEASRRDAFMRSRGSSFSRRGRGPPISPRSDNSVKDSWSGAGKVAPKNPELNRNLSGNNFSPVHSNHIGDMVNENSWNLERDKEPQEFNNLDKLMSPATNPELPTVPQPESYSGVTSLTPQTSLAAGLMETTPKMNESEKIWHYQDPSGKVQGPFSITQLRKWNNTGYFPADLRIWRTTDKQDNSILLADALTGKFPKEFSSADNISQATNTTLHSSSHTSTGHHSGKISTSSLLQDKERSNTGQNSGSHSERFLGNDITNLPSPTPRQSNVGWGAVGEGVSLTGSSSSVNQSTGVNGVLPSPTLPNTGNHSSLPVSLLNSVVQAAAAFTPPPNSQQVGPTVSLQTQATPMIELHTMQQQIHSQPSAPTPPAQQQTTISPNLQADNNTQGWGSNPQPGQLPQGYTPWGAPNVPNPSGSFPNSGTPAGIQPNMQQPPTVPNAPWGVGPPPTQPNPNMGWVNPVPGNMNMNWVPPPTPGWVPPPAPGNIAAPVQGGWAPWGNPPPPVNGWGPPPTGNAGGPPPPIPPVVQGNANQMWGSEQNRMGSRGGPGSRGQWNRQQSYGGGGGGRMKRDMLCPFNSNGRCRKGSRCDYRHA